jgi:ribosomal protein S18 acetylase RimI-like enzyme
MEISYITEIPCKNDFFQLYETTGWNEKYRKTKEILFDAIKNSWYNISAYNNNQLVGYGRVISDGILHAFIVDLMIAPSYQNKGIGKEILQQLIAEILDNGIHDIQLFCAKGKKEFYIKSGFKERSNDAPGMQYIIDICNKRQNYIDIV